VTVEGKGVDDRSNYREEVVVGLIC
jgi:hypothetical protein